MQTSPAISWGTWSRWLVSHLKLTWLVEQPSHKHKTKTLENPAHSEEFLAVITLTQKNKHQVGDPQTFMRKSIVHIYVYTYIFVIIYMYTITIMYIDVYISIIAIYVGNIHEHTILLNKVLSWWQCVGLYKPVLQWFPGAACFPVGQPDAWKSRWAFQLCFVLATHKKHGYPKKASQKKVQFHGSNSKFLQFYWANQVTKPWHLPNIHQENHQISQSAYSHRRVISGLIGAIEIKALPWRWGFVRISGRTKVPTVPPWCSNL